MYIHAPHLCRVPKRQERVRSSLKIELSYGEVAMRELGINPVLLEEKPVALTAEPISGPLIKLLRRILLGFH